jgi:hypothetical protein
MYLVNVCPTDLERQLLTADDKRRSMAVYHMGSGMVCGKDITKYYTKNSQVKEEKRIDASADWTAFST